jgi:hypothetical protein
MWIYGATVGANKLNPRLTMSYAEWNRIKAPKWPDWNTFNELYWDDLPEDCRADIRNRVLYIPGYHWSLTPILRQRFDGVEFIKRNYSTQCDADILTLMLFKGLHSGNYLEIGAGEPVDSNNTFLLKEWGWNGISVDINSEFSDLWKQQRKEDRLIIQDATTIDYLEILKKYNMPSNIELLQIDLDSHTVASDFLPLLPMDQYNFLLVMVEHDQFYCKTDNKKQIEKFFLEHGYIKLFNNMVCRNFKNDSWVPFEDWYVMPEYFDDNLLTKFSTANQNLTWSFEMLCQPNSLEEIAIAKKSTNIWPKNF